MKKQRKHYAPEEKVAILRRHLLEQVPISELCDKHGLQPTVFYRWQKEFFENGTAAFSRKGGPTIPAVVHFDDVLSSTQSLAVR
jgi:transposase